MAVPPDSSEVLGDRLRRLREKADNIVQRYVDPDKLPIYQEPKAIHDSVWGTHMLQPWAASLLDNPLIQRLRGIHQTSLAFLTYPTALHSRFDHSLGVAQVAGRMVAAIEANETLKADGIKIDASIKDNIQAACLLHDIGHGPFSHLAEEAYRHLGDFEGVIGSGTDYEGTKEHEFISCLLIETRTFRAVLARLNEVFGLGLETGLITKLISGRSLEPDLQYAVDIVNGPFDADKLDYLHRDTHFSGIPLKIDLDRLLFSAHISDVEGRSALTLDVRGATPLEQIVFSKAVLYSTLYHHHKVRASDCLFKSIVERLLDEDGAKLAQIEVNESLDLLQFTDHNFLSWQTDTNDAIVDGMLTSLLKRQIPKRALVISMNTLTDASDSLALFRLRPQTSAGAARKVHGMTRELREEIAMEVSKHAGRDITRYDVTLDLPNEPSLGDAILKEPDGRLVRLLEIFPVEQWVENYNQQRWTGHLFLPDDVRDPGAKVAAGILKERLGVDFKPEAFTRAKLGV